jgi:hypothetical protein
MRLSVTISALILSAAFLTTAHAQVVPTLDVGPTCQPFDGDISFKIDKDRCLKSESAARDELAKQWADFPVGHRKLCTQTATMGGMPSYVALITCLEMKRDAAKLPADQSLTTRPANMPKK